MVEWIIGVGMMLFGVNFNLYYFLLLGSIREVLMDEEGLNKTENNMIFVGQPIKMDDDEFLTSLDTLIRESEKNDGNIKGLVEGVCKTYTITENKKS